MSLIHSRFGLADMEALLWDPSSPMADPLGSYLHKDDEVLPPGGAESPLSSFSSSPHSPLSPPCAFPPPQSVVKAGLDHLSLPWLSADELCLANSGTDGGKENAFGEMDWMTERIDLSEFDLDSLIGSYESEDPPSSPEELLATLESQLDLEHLPQASDSTTALSSHPAPSPQPLASSVPMVTEDVPETQDEVEIKEEPASPVPSLSILPPESPTDTLELGCEVDVPEVQSPSPVELQVPKIVLSLSPTRIVVLLAPKREIPASVGTTEVLLPQNPPSPVSTPPRSPRVKPYTPLDPKSEKNPLSKPLALIKSDGGTKVVVVEKKKLKKMEQNKTAATRYRQKKRAEQEALLSECVALEERNQELFDKAESITKEIQYLKDLMEEVKRAREGRSVKSM